MIIYSNIPRNVSCVPTNSIFRIVFRYFSRVKAKPMCVLNLHQIKINIKNNVQHTFDDDAEN
jgi:hypothetical protein